MNTSPTAVTRRHFIRTATAAAAGASFPVSSRAQATARSVRTGRRAGERLNVACIGLRRGPGYAALRECLHTENVVALCDPDNSMAAHAIVGAADDGNPELLKVPRFQDYREMFAEMADKIDAVTVSTPDHHHFPAAMRRNRPKQWIPRVVGPVAEWLRAPKNGEERHMREMVVPIAEWLRAIKGEGPMPGSNFDYAADLSQTALLGTAAIRAGKRIEWDNQTGRVTNDPDLNRYTRIEARKGWNFV